MNYDRRTASGMTFHDYMKKTLVDFMTEVARKINAKQRYIKAEVVKDTSVAFVSFEGFDARDIEVSGHIWFDVKDENTVKFGIEVRDGKRGKQKEERTLKVGEVDAETVARLLYPYIVTSVI